MNQAQPRPPSRIARRAAQGLSLLLALGSNSEGTIAARDLREPGHLATDRPDGGSVPYLGAIGAPGLRFREPELIAELAARPAAVGPPIAGLTPVEVSVAVANAAAAHGVPHPAPTLVQGVVRPKPAAPPVSAPATPPAILPDDTRPQVHAEDFLPFFQIPGAGGPPGEVNLILPLPPDRPAPSPLPPSSATYNQTPR